jgi:hypothetical protein
MSIDLNRCKSNKIAVNRNKSNINLELRKKQKFNETNKHIAYQYGTA